MQRPGGVQPGAPLLDEELGVEPSPQLRAVQAAVLAQDPALLGNRVADPSDTSPLDDAISVE